MAQTSLNSTGVASSGSLVLQTNGTTSAVTIDTSQNVGIGTTSPATNLHIQASTQPTIQFTDVGTGAGRISMTNAMIFGVDGSDGSTERARIDSSGRFLLNTTSLVQSGQLSIINTSTTNGIASKDSGSSNFLYVGLNSSGTITFRVDANGDVKNTNNSYGAISDAKMKENVVDATPKLEKLNQVRVVNFNIIGEEQKQIGVIAQELEQIFPSMVDETPDRDSDGNDLGTTTKSVKYSVFVPMLIKAMQEQQDLITQLQADVAALKA